MITRNKKIARPKQGARSKQTTTSRPSGASPAQVRSVLPVVIFAALLALGAVFFVWQRHQHVQLGFEVAELRRAKALLEEQIEPLTVEVEFLSRLERINTLARKQLGLSQPQPGQITIIE